MLFVCHLKVCISIVSSFSWGHFNSQEKLKTMLMQNFGVTNEEHYGMLWYFWSGLLRDVTPCDFPPKNLYFLLPQQSMRTTFRYPESPYGRTYVDVITKISRMDSLPNYLSYGASRAQGAPLSCNN